ncbi:MAG TPA: crosslink repair DNA glycosylase YcaQ family protein [Terriglobales bacterium]|nr:crosslink repair DNA glycosylase YcaQ family protein [Terriglobales bacterium]
MTHEELQEQRREKWRLKSEPIRTLEDGRAFMENVGFCLMYPLHPPVLVPTFIGAYVGADENLPTSQMAFADPRAKDATELMVRLLRDRAAYEANLFGETNFLVSAAVFPYFYGLVGDRNPRHMPKPGTRSEYSPLARDVFNAINKHGAMSKAQLHDRLGGALSDSALDRALNDLWTRLRITRVDYRPDEGTFWDVLYRWSPEAVKEGVEISIPEALSALVGKYVEAMIAVEASEVEEFFSNMVSRAKVRDAVNALLAARELALTHVGNRSMLQIPSRQPVVPPPDPARRQPIARRPRPGVRR